MATNEDTTAQAALELRRAAERVIREYREHDELEIQPMDEGKLVRLRNELAIALDKLEDALDVATDTAEVLASQGVNEASANDDTGPSFGELYENALERFQALAAIAHLLRNDDGLDDVIRDAANHAWSVAHSGVKIMPQLWERHGEEYERKARPESSEPREWTGASAEVECRRLAARILALPDYAVDEIRDFALYINVALREKAGEITIDEIRDMLERGTPIRSIVSFAYLKSKGVAVHSPAALAETTADEQRGEA